jgi:hypothetical protein
MADTTETARILFYGYGSGTSVLPSLHRIILFLVSSFCNEVGTSEDFRFNFKRAFIFASLSVVWITLAIWNHFGFALDDVFFPDWREQHVQKPMFIVGNARFVPHLLNPACLPAYLFPPHFTHSKRFSLATACSLPTSARFLRAYCPHTARILPPFCPVLSAFCQLYAHFRSLSAHFCLLSALFCSLSARILPASSRFCPVLPALLPAFCPLLLAFSPLLPTFNPLLPAFCPLLLAFCPLLLAFSPLLPAFCPLLPAFCPLLLAFSPLLPDLLSAHFCSLSARILLAFCPLQVGSARILPASSRFCSLSARSLPTFS